MQFRTGRLPALLAAAFALLAACDGTTGPHDRPAPVVTITWPEENTLTLLAPYLDVDVGVTDSSGIASLWYRVGSSDPVRIPVDSLVHSAALRVRIPVPVGTSDVQVYAIGAAGGQGSATRHVTRMPLATLTGARSVSVGIDHACAAMADGSVYCWSGEDVARKVATSTALTSLAAGLGFTCGLTAAGEAWCWGGSDLGALAATTSGSGLIKVPGGITFRSLSAGSDYVCGVSTDGAGWCWGSNESGQLGDSTTTSRPLPTRVAGGLSFTSLQAGTIAFWMDKPTTCGISGGKTYCWGYSYRGRFGRDWLASVPLPTATQPSLAAVEARSGDPYVYALGADGGVYRWGCDSNSEGFLTDCVNAHRMAAATSFSAFAGGIDQACALTAAGEAYCTDPHAGSFPGAMVQVPGGFRFRAIAAGGAVACGVSSSADATVYCWGSALLGHPGAEPKSPPVAVQKLQ